MSAHESSIYRLTDRVIAVLKLPPCPATRDWVGSLTIRQLAELDGIVGGVRKTTIEAHGEAVPASGRAA